MSPTRRRPSGNQRGGGRAGTDHRRRARAGVNVPRLLGSLDEAGFLRTLAPKIQGARNVLNAVDADRLRLLVTFGSIIARTGLPGEADYCRRQRMAGSIDRAVSAKASQMPLPGPGVVGLVRRRDGRSAGPRRGAGEPGDYAHST